MFSGFREAWRLYRFVVTHPLNRENPTDALLRTLRWQIGSRILGGTAVIDWVEGSRLIVRRGMTGATGNIYAGLHEYEDMAFVLHYLDADELFLDIGANVGSYTVLAASACRARVYSFEPTPSTFRSLLDNVRLNAIDALVQPFNVALGDESGKLLFTTHADTVNHIATETDAGHSQVEVPVKRLDDLLGEQTAVLVKLDVEGYETMVLRGATRALASVSAVIVELNGSGERYGHTDAETIVTLQSYGFRPMRYEPSSRTLLALDAPASEGNTIFVRDLEDAQRRLKRARTFRIFTGQV